MKKACERWVNACLSCLQKNDSRKMSLPLKSVETSEFNEVVQLDHQKICKTESGYNQILVIFYNLRKLAEEKPCQTASAEKTCDHFTHIGSQDKVGRLPFNQTTGRPSMGI